MAPTRNVYVKEGDRDIWDRAQQIAGGNLSSLITRLLADYLEGARQDEEKLQKVIKRLAKKGIEESKVREIARRFSLTTAFGTTLWKTQRERSRPLLVVKGRRCLRQPSLR